MLILGIIIISETCYTVTGEKCLYRDILSQVRQIYIGIYHYRSDMFILGYFFTGETCSYWDILLQVRHGI